MKSQKLNYYLVLFVLVTLFKQIFVLNEIINTNKTESVSDIEIDSQLNEPGTNSNQYDELNQEKSESNKESNREDVDYFYDEKLSEEEIEKRKKEAEEAERMKKQQEKDKNQQEQEPEWFQKSKENEKDPFAEFMKKQIEEYLKNYRKEQIEKLKSKTKSDLDHKFLSIIFVSAFFITGTIIGLIVVFIRGNGHRFSKLTNSKSKNKKNINNDIYKPVLENNNMTINNNNDLSV